MKKYIVVFAIMAVGVILHTLIIVLQISKIDDCLIDVDQRLTALEQGKCFCDTVDVRQYQEIKEIAYKVRLIELELNQLKEDVEW